jgi:hypothetical protein
MDAEREEISLGYFTHTLIAICGYAMGMSETRIIVTLS